MTNVTHHFFYVFIYIFNSLHVSSTLCSSSGETNCVNTASGSCHSVSVAVSCAGPKFTYFRPAHDTICLDYILITNFDALIIIYS